MKIIKARKLDAIAQSAKSGQSPISVVTRINAAGEPLQHAIFIDAKDIGPIEAALDCLGLKARKVTLEDFEELGDE